MTSELRVRKRLLSNPNLSLVLLSKPNLSQSIFGFRSIVAIYHERQHRSYYEIFDR